MVRYPKENFELEVLVGKRKGGRNRKGEAPSCLHAQEIRGRDRDAWEKAPLLHELSPDPFD